MHETGKPVHKKLTLFTHMHDEVLCVCVRERDSEHVRGERTKPLLSDRETKAEAPGHSPLPDLKDLVTFARFFFTLGK